MDRKKFSPEKEKLHFAFPDAMEFQELSFGELHKKWSANDQKFREIIRDRHIPFFGVHGAPKRAINGLCQSENGSIEIATFYHRPDDVSEYLANLYAMCGYSINYAFNRGEAKKDPGGLLILNLEKNEKNITFPWEHLLGTNGALEFTLPNDNTAELEVIKFITEWQKRKETWPQRTGLQLQPENFKSIVKGVYGYKDAKPYLDARNTDVQNDYGKMILGTRLLTQDILRVCLKKLKVI